MINRRKNELTGLSSNYSILYSLSTYPSAGDYLNY